MPYVCLLDGLADEPDVRGGSDGRNASAIQGNPDLIQILTFNRHCERLHKPKSMLVV